MGVLTDTQWAVLEPLVEVCRPHAKVPPSDLSLRIERRREQAPDRF